MITGPCGANKGQTIWYVGRGGGGMVFLRDIDLPNLTNKAQIHEIYMKINIKNNYGHRPCGGNKGQTIWYVGGGGLGFFYLLSFFTPSLNLQFFSYQSGQTQNNFSPFILFDSQVHLLRWTFNHNFFY